MLKGWRTILTGVATLVLAVITGITKDTAASAFITEHWPWFLGASGTLTIFLRFITTTEVFKPKT